MVLKKKCTYNSAWSSSGGDRLCSMAIIPFPLFVECFLLLVFLTLVESTIPCWQGNVKLKLQTVILHTILDYVRGENKYSANSFLWYILVDSVASKLQVFSVHVTTTETCNVGNCSKKLVSISINPSETNYTNYRQSQGKFKLFTYIILAVSSNSEATVHCPVLLFARRQRWYLVSSTWIDTYRQWRHPSWHGWNCTGCWRCPPVGRWNSPCRWYSSAWTT